MEINLTKEDSEKFYHSALCNGGLNELSASGIIFDYDADEYKRAKKSLQDKGFKNEFGESEICWEDVLMEILRIGGMLKFIDEEGDGEYSRNVTLEMVHNNTCKLQQNSLLDYIQGNDDAVTAFCLLQAVMYDGEIIFG